MVKVKLLKMIDSLNDALIKEYSFDVATIYEELNSASQAGLLENAWRKKLPECQIQMFLDVRRNEIESKWNQKYEQLRRILDYGGILEYEEMMLVLSLRSGLELCKNYLSFEISEKLRVLDRGLKETIENNLSVQADCAVQIKSSFLPFLESHWWWRKT